MTHNELLERLDDQIEKSKLIGCECAACDNALAIRAVVELHKPIEGTPYCEGCDLLRRYYPCPTIQVIRKELQ